VRSKGGATEWVFWQPGCAQLLPRLLAGRTAGPVFLADRRPGRVGAAVLARLDFVLEQLCADVDAQFVEVVLLSNAQDAVERFLRRSVASQSAARAP